MRLLNLASTEEYVLESDRIYENDGKTWTPREDATTWTLCVIDSSALAAILDKSSKISIDAETNQPSGTMSTHQNNANICQFGIKGWSHLKAHDGNEVAFRTQVRFVSGVKHEVVDPDILKLIPLAEQKELADRIMELNTVKEEEVKN